METEVIGNSSRGMHKVRVKVSRQYFEELKQHLSREEPDFPEVIYMDEPKEVLDDLVEMIYEKNQLFTTLRGLDGSVYTDIDADTLTERYVELSKIIEMKISTLRDKYLPEQQTHYFADFLRGYFVERNAQKRKAVRETHQV